MAPYALPHNLPTAGLCRGNPVLRPVLTSAAAQGIQEAAGTSQASAAVVPHRAGESGKVPTVEATDLQQPQIVCCNQWHEGHDHQQASMGNPCWQPRVPLATNCPEAGKTAQNRHMDISQLVFCAILAQMLVPVSADGSRERFSSWVSGICIQQSAPHQHLTT